MFQHDFCAHILVTFVKEARDKAFKLKAPVLCSLYSLLCFGQHDGSMRKKYKVQVGLEIDLSIVEK